MAEREATGSTGSTGSFDAFDPSTWRFEPAPVPWYRRKQALTALIAVAAAAGAIVVSGVLLLFDGSGAVHEETAPAPASTAPETKKPEFGVTRTQETRRPISVAPRRPG